MIDSAFLIPPGSGPKANPLLFGVAAALLRLFPLPEADPALSGGPREVGGMPETPAVSEADASE